MGKIPKVFSKSVQVQHGTQKLIVRRNDVRVPQLPGHTEQSLSESRPSPILSRKKRSWDSRSNTSSLNLHKMEQLEEEEETFEIENAMLKCEKSVTGIAAKKARKLVLIPDTINAPAVIKEPRIVMIRKI
jgi:hypothetical protein